MIYSVWTSKSKNVLYFFFSMSASGFYQYSFFASTRPFALFRVDAYFMLNLIFIDSEIVSIIILSIYFFINEGALLLLLLLLYVI